MFGCKWQGEALRERREALGNPGRGLYTIYKYHAHDELVPDLGYAIEQSVLRPDQVLCLVEINLIRYRQEVLPREALARVGRIFAFFAAAGRQMLVRFLYDWDGRGLESEPEELATILGHMEQLAPLLRQYAGSIYLLQGLFIGSWGEMHASRHLAAQDLMALARRLHECAPETYIAVRTPALWRTILRTHAPTSEAQARTAGLQARLCLFNDGILGSETDLGTYAERPRTRVTAYGDKGDRAQELAFQQALCRFVPNGGEVVAAANEVSFEQVIADFARMRLSYLNADYDPAVLNRWQQCAPRVRARIWRQSNVYDYIAAHLGYRYRLERVRVARRKGRLVVRLRLVNDGFSGAYQRFEVALVRWSDAPAQAIHHPIEADVCDWQPGRPVELTAELDARDWAVGDWALGLSIAEPTGGRSVRLSNLPWEAACGANVLGRLQIDGSWGGRRDERHA